MHEEARELALFAKECGQGLRQQRVSDKTVSLPLAPDKSLSSG